MQSLSHVGSIHDLDFDTGDYLTGMGLCIITRTTLQLISLLLLDMYGYVICQPQSYNPNLPFIVQGGGIVETNPSQFRTFQIKCILFLRAPTRSSELHTCLTWALATKTRSPSIQ